MPGTAPIRGVVFDAYGTLFDVYSVRELAEELFPGSGAALTALWRDRQIDYSRIRTLCGRYIDFWSITRDALEFACDFLKLKLTAAAAEQLMGQYARLSPFPENVAALHRLRERGLPLAVLSNGSPDMLASAITAAGMDGLFDHILSVHQVRRFKTAPQAYQLGPDAFDCPAEELLFVSSNSWDICGATWFGYTTLWINRAGNPPERLGVSPTLEGRSLDDVVNFTAGKKPV